jgi:hypothetical protein
MSDGFNGATGDNARYVQQQGTENQARQEQIVNAFFYLAGRVLNGTDSQFVLPERAGSTGRIDTGINPVTGETFRYGVAGSDTSNRQAERNAAPSQFAQLALLAAIVFIVVKVV